MVRLGQLDLVFKIRHGPQAPHHHRSVLLFGKIHSQAIEALHGDIRDVLAALFQQLYPLLNGEQRVFRAVDEHSHDQFVVDLCRTLDDIEMTPGDRVE